MQVSAVTFITEVIFADSASLASCSAAFPGSLVATIVPLYSMLYIEFIQCVLARF